MKGDFSRRTFDADKHYSAVLVEQGRLLTDADSEEEHRILEYREEHATNDVIGACGGPLPNAGFGLTAPEPTELRIGRGPYYAAGTLLENESEIAFTKQLDRFDVGWPPEHGRHAIVLQSWRRLVTALDDPSIREVALGGPTTSARERVIWQVHAVPVEDNWACTDELPEPEQTTGQLAARAEPEAELTSPCLIPPQAGYTGLENQLYRAEIFDSGDAYDLDAAPDTVTVTGFPGGSTNQLTVAEVGTLTLGDGVEVFRTGTGRDPIAATFGYITNVDGSTLTLSTSLPTFGPDDAPMLRRVDAAFVVSRENGSVVTTIESIDGVEITVHDIGPEPVLGFGIGQLVEITDDRIELEGLPRRLHEIADIDLPRRVIVLRTPAERLHIDPQHPSGVLPERHPKLRRWDAVGAVRFRQDGSGWIHLENGNQVRFLAGHYRSGDYWTFPARAAIIDAASGTIEWPQEQDAENPSPALRSPFGIERHRCVLGYVDISETGRILSVEDCRNLFPPLTAMRTLLYVGGDGQEGSLSKAVGGFIPLPGQLEVRVVNGSFPVAQAPVLFSVTQGSGRLQGADPTFNVATDENGLASCSWEIDTGEDHQVVVAQLLTPSGVPIPHQVVRFHAIIDRDPVGGGGGGCCVSIGEGGDFPNLDEALSALGGQRHISLCLMDGDYFFPGGDFSVGTHQRAHLSIHGNGRGARVVMEGSWELREWAAVRLVDFDIVVGEDGCIVLDGVSDVEIRGMRISGGSSAERMVRAYGFERLQVTGSVLQARVFDTLEGPRLVTEGLDPLRRPWDFDNEEQLRQTLLDAALQAAALDPATRADLVTQLRKNISGMHDQISLGEEEAFTRLAFAIEVAEEAGAGPILHELELVLEAAVMAHPGVALEIGGLRVGSHPEVPVRASVLIADNHIAGVINFYGSSDLGQLIREDVLERLDFLVSGLPMAGIGGDVHVRDNRFSRLALGNEIINLLIDLIGNQRPVTAIYESFHLTDNVIDGVVSETIARHTVVNSNHFTLNGLRPTDAPPSNHVARVVGDTAVYMGNQAGIIPAAAGLAVIRDVTRFNTEAANLEIQIV